MRLKLGLTHYLVILLVVLLVGLPLYTTLVSDGSNVVDVSEDDDPVRGDPDAPVTMVEFSDFACPACWSIQSILHSILDDYEGQVKLVFRDFPFVSPHSQKAAEAAQCVFDQDPSLYWDYHDKLFERQDEWSASADAVSFFVGYATGTGVPDIDQFIQCLENGDFTQEVQKDKDDGESYGVAGTPTIYVNGHQLSGVPSYDNLRTAIEDALQG